ncbi:PHP domain-containing protein [Portibacter lacus]|uniref:Histidinol-phosphatase n=1 Tax=Portibacter lacus TaxID=1099794 RepID=A0AA37STJ7_9BACT|nr:hypothetical protein [Portibacter lacus]GLR19892.1 hypothetical protein GCM10007940_45080 [Portibacter lacus]
MKNLSYFLPFIALLIISCSEQEETSQKKWYKGNLHTHSYWSDGDEFPEVIMDWYKSNDYQFVALTDHNILAEGEKWKVISQDSIYMDAFDNYLKEYGEDWVNYKIDSLGRTQVKLKTFDEYHGRFEEEENFLIMNSEEISDYFEGKPLHMNATNIREKIEPQGGNSVVEVLQNNIDAVMKQREESGVPMIPHVNHPNFFYAITLADMIALKNERFFEVYNGHHMVNNSGDSINMSTEEMWDKINIAYIKKEMPLMYGLATDDSHHYHVNGKEWSNSGRGWIVVRADSLNPSSLINAMEAGDFYASTGVEIKDLKTDDKSISVEIKQEAGETYEITFIGCKKGSEEPEEFMTISGNQAKFEFTNDISFVRCKITSSKLHENPIEELIYEMAWTQPVQVTMN